MIVDKINKFLEDNDRKLLDPVFTGEYMEDVLNAMKRQFFDEHEDRRKLRLSSIGRCLRMQAYNILGYEKLDQITPRLKTIFHLGDLIEANIICLANHAGAPITNQQDECSLEGIKGHIDGEYLDEDRGKRYLVEIKSMSDFSFKKFKTKEMSDEGFGYVTQANSYAYSRGLDGIVWVAMNKNNGQLHEEIRDVDKDLAEQTIDNIKGLKSCKDPNVFERYSVEDETWYGKPTGNKILSFQCSTCDFVNQCFNGCTKWERKGKIKHYAGDIRHGKWSEGGRVC